MPKYTKRTGTPGNYKYEYADDKAIAAQVEQQEREYAERAYNPPAPKPSGKHHPEFKGVHTQQLKLLARKLDRNSEQGKKVRDELYYRAENIQAATALNSINEANNAVVTEVTPTKITFIGTMFAANGIKKDGHPVKLVKKGAPVPPGQEPNPHTFSIDVAPNKERRYEVADPHLGDMAVVRTLAPVDARSLTSSKRVEKSMSLTDWIQKSEAQPETFEKGMPYVDDWAMQFGGTDMHVDALQCLKDMMALRKERESFNAAGKSWREEEDMAGTARKAYRDKRMKEREKLNGREDSIRVRMAGLEEKLLDQRIKDAKAMRKSETGGSTMEGDTLQKSYRAIKNAYEKKYGAGAWAKIDVPKDVQESKAKAEKLPFGSKTKLSNEEHYRYTEAKKKLAGSLGMPTSGWGLYGRSIAGAIKNKEEKKGEETKKSFTGDDGKPGKSLKETTTEELKATLAKIKPTDNGAQARIAAIKAELKTRGNEGTEKGLSGSKPLVGSTHKPMVGSDTKPMADKSMEKAKKQPSQSTSLTPEKARQMLHEGSGGHGRPITEQQRKFFGAVGGHLPAPKGKVKKAMSYDSLDDFLEKAEAPDFKEWVMKIFSKKGESVEKSMAEVYDILFEDLLAKAEGGPFVGPRGGKWADAQHTIPWSEKRAQAGKKQEQPKGTADQPFAEELKLTIENEGQLYNQIQSIQKNLVNKIANGNYDHAQAAKLWNYAVENGAKLYEKQFGVKADKATRMAAARAMSDQFFDEAVNGEYSHMLNKKNAKAMEGMSAEDMKALATGKAKPPTKTKMALDKKPTGAKISVDMGGETYGAEKMASGKWQVWREGAEGRESMDSSKVADLMDQAKESTKKSMEGVMSLEEYLEKSGGLPTGEPSLESNPANGGAVAGVGMTSGSSDSASGPGQNAQGQLSGVPTGGKEKLSEDDADVEGQMTTHKKPIETIKKSAFPADQRDSVARERAAAVSQLHKSDDVYVGPNAHPFSSHATHASGDADASELVKSEGFYHGSSPQVAPGRPIIEQGVLCKSINAGGCDSVYSAALTSCPDCGAGTVGHRHLPGGEVVGAQTTILEKSMGPGSLLRRPPQEPDIKIG